MIAVSCLAQTPSTNTFDEARFIICYEGKAVCKIEVRGLETASVSPEERTILKADGHRLQTYFYLMSGCRIPIDKVDAMPTDQSMPYTIVLMIGATASGPSRARINLYRFAPPYTTPVLQIADEEPMFFEDAGERGKRQTHPRISGRNALDAFGQQYFGVPMSAIDDPNFDWSAHHHSTLAIPYTDFQPIQFPPSKQ
jgi:hypothetical protein